MTRRGFKRVKQKEKTIMVAACLLSGGMLMAMTDKDRALVSVAAETAHFQKYKKGTLHMVKRLALLDHNALVPELKELVFKKGY